MARFSFSAEENSDPPLSLSWTQMNLRSSPRRWTRTASRCAHPLGSVTSRSALPRTS